MRDGQFATIMQQQEEDEAHTLMEKGQRGMTSTPIEKALILVHHALSFHHFLKAFIPQNLGVASKVTTLVMDSMFLFANRLLRLQVVFTVSGKIHCGCRVALHKLFIARDDLHQYIDESHRKDHKQSNRNFSGLPTYDLRSLGCILYHRLFGSRFCNFDCQQINSLLLFLYNIAFLYLLCS